MKTLKSQNAALSLSRLNYSFLILFCLFTCKTFASGESCSEAFFVNTSTDYQAQNYMVNNAD